MSELTEREKNIAISAFCNLRGSRDQSIIAAVEAVLAWREPIELLPDNDYTPHLGMDKTDEWEARQDAKAQPSAPAQITRYEAISNGDGTYTARRVAEPSQPSANVLVSPYYGNYVLDSLFLRFPQNTS